MSIVSGDWWQPRVAGGGQGRDGFATEDELDKRTGRRRIPPRVASCSRSRAAQPLRTIFEFSCLVAEGQRRSPWPLISLMICSARYCVNFRAVSPSAVMSWTFILQRTSPLASTSLTVTIE